MNAWLEKASRASERVARLLRPLFAVVDALRALLLRWMTPRASTRRRSWVVLVLALVVIPLWQKRFLDPTTTIANNVNVYASTGVHGEPHFFFFLYHLGLYPLRTTAPIKEDTKQEALRLLNDGPSLLVDEGVTFRSGDRGRVFLYYPDVWLHHDAINPKLQTANALGFCVALCALFAAFWWIRRPWMGGLLILMLGSDPFQLYTVYRQENVFGWAVTTAIVMMALHLPLMTRRAPTSPWLWWLPVVAGILLASARTIRSEGSLIAGSIVIVYMTLAGTRWWKRIALAGLFLATLSISTRLYTNYFLRRFEQTHAVMVAHGGTPYTGPLPIYHEFWHAVFCGLGDFDTKYGYTWDDRVAYKHALPILQARGLKYHWKPENYTYDESYDGTGKYAIFFSEAPGYHDIIRDKVVGDIKRDPRWYLDILKKRVWRILTETKPLSLYAWLDEPLSTKSAILGLLCLPLAALLALSRRWSYLKMLVFMAPLSAPALLVYSERGMTNYSTFHYFGAAIFCALMAEGARQWLRKPVDD